MKHLLNPLIIAVLIMAALIKWVDGHQIEIDIVGADALRSHRTQLESVIID